MTKRRIGKTSMVKSHTRKIGGKTIKVKGHKRTERQTGFTVKSLEKKIWPNAKKRIKTLYSQYTKAQGDEKKKIRRELLIENNDAHSTKPPGSGGSSWAIKGKPRLKGIENTLKAVGIKNPVI